MNGRLSLAGLVACGCFVVALESDVRAERPTGRVRPGTLPGIPDYPYTVPPDLGKVPPTTTVVSLVRIPPTPIPRQPQVYQLRETRLQVEHCFLSRVALAFQEDGTYQISFRADQNPQPGNDTASPLRPGETVQTLQQTTPLKRNLFIVKVRGYANFPDTTADRQNLSNGKPVLLEFKPIEVWVQRGQPYSGFVSDRSESVKRYFEYIDRIEVEFTYR